MLGKDNRTVKKYIIGNRKDLYKHIGYSYNPYENKVISLVKYRYIKKQIVDILIAERYKLSKSNARHMIHKIVKSNNLNINKYSPVINSLKTSSGAIDNKYIYLKRSYIFKDLFMDVELSETENEHIYHNYPQIFTLKKCIIEFREIFKTKNLALLYIFIDKYRNSDISEIASLYKWIIKGY